MADPTPADLARRELARRELERRGIAVPATEPAKAPRRPMGSTSSIGGPPPAGEADAPAARGVLQTIADTVTGSQRQTEETETAPDFNLMPEMRTATVARQVPALGAVAAPSIAAVEIAVRELAKDNPSLSKALGNYVASVKTGVGTQLASPEEQAKIITANNPDVKMRRDDKGNVFLTSAQDGKEYVIKPGLRPSDAPQIAQTAAAFTPAGRAAGIGRSVLASGGTQALIEATQSATGGEFNGADVALASAGGALSGGYGVARDAIKANAAQTAARVAEAAPRVAAAQAATKAPGSFKDVVAPLESVAEQVAKLSPKQRWALKQVPFVGKALDGIDELVKILKDETEEGAKKLPKEAQEVVDDILKGADEATDTATVPLAEPAAPADEAASALSAVDNTITPTPTVKARTGPTATPSATPPTPLPAPLDATVGRMRPPAVAVPEDPTATARVARMPAPTEGLDPTEVLQAPIAEAPAAAPAVRGRRLSDDEATALVRDVALREGTRDLATIASKAGISSSQAQRALEKLSKNFRFRTEVDAAAAAKAPAVEMPTSAPARVPAADLLEGVAAQNAGGKVTPTTLRQEAAIVRGQQQAVTIGDFANKMRALPSDQRGTFLRVIKKERGLDFAKKVAKEVGMSTKGIG